MSARCEAVSDPRPSPRPGDGVCVREARHGWLWWFMALALAAGCEARNDSVVSAGESTASAASSGSAALEQLGNEASDSHRAKAERPPWAPVKREPPVAKGMVWIEPGTLIAGTPPEQVPRKADQEMPGEQVVLAGFYIDEYAHPNEQGAIPTTNVTQAEARGMCEEQGKRLCSELEWERACKGPRNLKYEYGEVYQAGICETGGPARTLPSGYRFSCRSEFNVYDLHGSLWEWTDSPWGRGEERVWVTLRGGNGPDGEVVGRCANARGVPASTKDRTIGFRCCSGPRNAAEVSLTLDEGAVLRHIPRPDRALLESLTNKLPETIREEMKRYGLFRMNQLWEWKPVSNEDLLLAGGCAGVAPRRRCGVMVVRRSLGRLDLLDWVSSGHFPPTVKLEHDPRRVWLYGGDRRSHFRTRVDFVWGKVRVAAPERNVKR